MIFDNYSITKRYNIRVIYIINLNDINVSSHSFFDAIIKINKSFVLFISFEIFSHLDDDNHLYMR